MFGKLLMEQVSVRKCCDTETEMLHGNNWFKQLCGKQVGFQWKPACLSSAPNSLLACLEAQYVLGLSDILLCSSEPSSVWRSYLELGLSQFLGILKHKKPGSPYSSGNS